MNCIKKKHYWYGFRFFIDKEKAYQGLREASPVGEYEVFLTRNDLNTWGGSQITKGDIQYLLGVSEEEIKLKHQQAINLIKTHENKIKKLLSLGGIEFFDTQHNKEKCNHVIYLPKKEILKISESLDKNVYDSIYNQLRSTKILEHKLLYFRVPRDRVGLDSFYTRIEGGGELIEALKKQMEKKTADQGKTNELHQK